MNRGFTLIEVIIVIAIVSILAGIMIPFIYRVWENAEIETTRERMSDLKKAIVGDPRLIQNGVRINYGYVGDCGTLPGKLENLIVADSNECPNWKGPYLPAGFNSSDYDKDAWGNSFNYTIIERIDSLGRRIVASLISAGPNRQFDSCTSGDDICLDIYQDEVTPVKSIEGNLNLSFYNATSNPQSPSYSVKVSELLYGQGTCISLDVGQVNPSETKRITKNFKIDLNIYYSAGNNIINTQVELFSDSNCSQKLKSSNYAEMISMMSEAIYLNLPFSYTIQ